MKRRLSPIIFALILMFGISSISPAALAAASLTPLSISSADAIDADFNTIADSEIFDEVQSQTNLTTKAKNTLLPITNGHTPLIASASETMPLANAQLDLGTHPFGNLTAALNQDQRHILLFNLTQKTVLFSKMTSANNEYAYQIFSVNSDGTLSPFSNAVLAGGEVNGTIPAGLYAFVVANTGETFGDTYTLFLNTATPCPADADSISLISLSNSYNHVTVQIITSTDKMIVYCDGVKVIDENDTKMLDWERVLDLNWGSGYNYNKHEIYNAKVRGVSQVGTYTSDFVTSKNAVILFLDAGTGFMYNESKRNWDTGEHIYHYTDPAGNTTPRTLTSNDIGNYHCWLVFDLTTGQPIDFWSSLNWYYATGSEEASFSLNAD